MLLRSECCCRESRISLSVAIRESRKNTSPVAGVFLAVRPTPLSRIVLDVRSRISGRSQRLRDAFGFPYQRFSSLLHDEASPSETNKQKWFSNGNHGSIWDSQPIAFSGYPRGTRVGCETSVPEARVA